MYKLRKSQRKGDIQLNKLRKIFWCYKIYVSIKIIYLLIRLAIKYLVILLNQVVNLNCNVKFAVMIFTLQEKTCVRTASTSLLISSSKARVFRNRNTPPRNTKIVIF